MSEFQFKAEPVAVRIRYYRRKARITLGSYPDILKSLAVYDHIAVIIFLGHRIFEHVVKVVLVHDYIDRYDLTCVKQCRFI